MATDNALKTAMKIRHVSTNDKSEWIRMRTALWPESSDDHSVEINQFFSKPDDALATLVAEIEKGKLCGFLEAGTRPYAEKCQSSPVGYIEGWWVDPEYRKHGCGAALAEAAEDWARSLGLSEMASDADLANTLSHNAHRALGYSEVQRIVCFRKSL